MAQSSYVAVEHSVRIPAHGAGQGEVAPPERRLNCFVRSVALIERLGNALGTLAFTWATVVLLGGSLTVLTRKDYWFATAIFFLEAARMFSRNNRMDYQLFFGTRGALTSLGWNGLILIVYFNDVVCIIAQKSRFLAALFLPLLGILVAVGQFVCPGARRLLARVPRRRAISLWSPVVAVILLGPSVLILGYQDFEFDYLYLGIKNSAKLVGKVTACAVLLVVVLLVTVSRVRSPSALGSKQEFWSRVVLNLCMVGAIVLASFSLGHDEPYTVLLVILVEASTIVFVSFGNFQIPAAIVRVVLPVISLTSISKDYKDNCSTKDLDDARQSPAPAPSSGAVCNPGMVKLAPSIGIFYGMVLGQGVLYVVACVLEIFSFIPRRSLVHRGGFKGQWGVDSVNLYYAYALEKCLERNVLDPKISLCNFAIDSLNADSTKRQLHGIRVTHILLQRDPTRTWLLVKLNASTETMTRLVRMLDWNGQGHDTIRLFAVKVVDELAKSLLVATVPGIVQNVSLLFDCGDQRKRGNPLLDAKDEQEQQNDPSVNAIGNQMEGGDAVPDTRNLLETEDRSTTQQVRNNEHNSRIARWWRQVFEFWSIPQEGTMTEQDLLPVLGMSIIENLAAYDQSNCEEISKATALIRRIARFCRSDTNYTDAEKKALVHSSLKLFHRLTSIDGEIGITLRRKISKHPFLLTNLSEILGDITIYHETRKLAAGILRNLAVDASMRQTIGNVQRITDRLMDAFLPPDSSSNTDGDRLLRKVAGQALAMLAMDNVNTCLAMLRKRMSFIKDLTDMIRVDRYRCVAASLLRSVCMHARPELKETDLKLLSEISRKVLEIMLRAKGAELEIFVGLSSHIYKAIPEEFAREFDYGGIKENFAKRLVDALNANMEPNSDCPGIRRVILEQAINLMECDLRNVNWFHDYGMMKAVLTVEETISEAENYSIFLGDAGLMEAGEPLSSLVARVKQLLGAVR